ncbi:MAG: hypothetical protein IPM24_24560 [Bryobacterales bacterium]|nr:hypothetical protein [Bryobacterales bacterium]
MSRAMLVFLLCGAAWAADKPAFEVNGGGLILTSSGAIVGAPRKTLNGWPRSEVHKHFGLPREIFGLSNETGQFTERLSEYRSFKRRGPVAEVYEVRNEFLSYRMWLDYEIDPTMPRLGIKQRVRSMTVRLPNPANVWEFLASRAAGLVDPMDLCTHYCTAHWIVGGGESFVFLSPKAPTADDRDVARLVASRYVPSRAREDWSLGVKIWLQPDSTLIDRIEVLPVIAADQVRPAEGRAIEKLGLWAAP